MRLFTLLALLTGFGAFAQNNYKPGYIIVSVGDTLRGQVDFRRESVNPQTMFFRGSGGDQQYGVNNLVGFAIDGEVVYRRFSVTYEESAAELADAKETFDGTVVNTVAWLKLEYDGAYSLYELVTSKRKHYFIHSAKNGLKELIYRVRLNVEGSLEKDEQYKNLLSLYALEAGSSDAVAKKIESTNYSSDHLKKTVHVLNGSSGSFSSAKTTRDKWDISAGFAFYSFNPGGRIFNDGSGAYSLYAATFKSSVGFLGGVGYSAMGKNNIRIGVNIGSMSIDGENNTGDGAFDREMYKGNILFAEPNASFEFGLTKNKPTNVYLGFMFGGNIIINSAITSTFENPGVTIVKEDFPPTGGLFLTAGLSATASGNWGRLNLRAARFSNIFENTATALKGIQLGLSYGFYIKK